jgi:hypothetical protein
MQDSGMVIGRPGAKTPRLLFSSRLGVLAADLKKIAAKPRFIKNAQHFLQLT